MHIVPMIVDRIVEAIQDKLVDNTLEQDLSRVTIVKSGLLQEEKLERRIAVGVTGGDHEDPDMIDGIMSIDKFPDIGAYFPPREIGGGQGWWRRGTLQLDMYLLGEGLKENDARDAAYEALRRIIETVRGISVDMLRDDSGERAIKIYVPYHTFSQGGGAPSSFIFRGKIYWFVATNVP